MVPSGCVFVSVCTLFLALEAQTEKKITHTTHSVKGNNAVALIACVCASDGDGASAGTGVGTAAAAAAAAAVYDDDDGMVLFFVSYFLFSIPIILCALCIVVPASDQSKNAFLFADRTTEPLLFLFCPY